MASRCRFVCHIVLVGRADSEVVIGHTIMEVCGDYEK